MENKSYIINDQKVISEVLDGETIIINLENGNYYSMNDTGSDLWGRIKSQQSMENIIKGFVNQYTADISEIERSIDEVINFLLTDHLIIKADVSDESIDEIAEVAKKEFIKPIINRFEDMQDMLLADPIHEVDNIGWPTQKDKV